jgi:hypothetical protein
MKSSTGLKIWGFSRAGWCAAALSVALCTAAFGAAAAADNGPIDWSRARALHQKEVAGGKLSADDQVYLDRAKAAMARGEGPGRPAGVSQDDLRRARELNQKVQAGETLSADERSFLDGIRAKMQRGGGGGGAGALAAAGIDPQKARALFEKSQNGETLTTEEQAYLDKARAIMQRRQQGGAGPGQGTGPSSGKPAITNQESTGFIPLTQLRGGQKYKGVEGGLYGNGSNVPPEPLQQAALQMAAKVVPLDADGKPSPDGKAVLMSIGMSNTTMEFSKFKQLADADSRKSPSLQIVDAAQGGKDAPAWANVGATGTNPVWDEADRRLKSSGVTPKQVEAIWIKQATAGPARLGDFPAHSDALQKDVETIIKLAKTRYPNLRLAYLSSRIYGGYANTMLNPEPYAYEGAFAMRGVILDQLKSDAAKPEIQAPVVLWGPYLWADGVKGREGDDLVYKREDLGEDGTHPSASGRHKVAELLLKFFTTDASAVPWFVKSTGQQDAAKKTDSAASPAPALGSVHADVSWSRDDAAHLLRRAGFGGTPAQIDSLHAMGREAAVDYLVTGHLPSGATAPFEHVDLPELPSDLSVDYRVQGPLLQYKLQELRGWWIDRMVRSDRPLEEKMTLFWHGLFCSGVREVKNVQALGQQNDLFHREAIGNYKRLTSDIIHDAAMIRYLNNDENQKGRPNENLARELMELFTMGEGNGYTEADIPEVARALTGMTVDRFGETSQFILARHDDGPKTIFGKTGNYTPDDVPELIFARAEPATYLARRLWQYFGTPEPAEQDVAAVAATLKGSEWELAPALRTLFNSPSFYGDACKFAVIKSPAELEAMTLRLLEEPPQPRMLWAASLSLRDMGEELFQPPNVKGWPGEDRWITSATLNTRYSVASAMAGGRLGFGFFPGMRAGFANPPPGAARPAFAPGARPLRPGLAAATTQPAGNGGKANLPPTAADARFARIQAIRQEQAEQVRDAISKMALMPPPGRMVVPSKLFPGLGAEPTASELVDAAAARFLQSPLPAKDKEAFVKSLGTRPLSLGNPETDDRVRGMIGAMLATPQYQME